MYEKEILALKNELRIMGMSQKTIKNYTSCLQDFLCYCKNPDICNTDEIKEFILTKYSKNYSSSTINLFLSAIKFYYRNIKGEYFKLNIKSSKKPKRLPVVLSQSEVKDLIEVIENSKHKLLISLTYGAGLRVSEIVRLKVWWKKCFVRLYHHL